MSKTTRKFAPSNHRKGDFSNTFSAVLTTVFHSRILRRRHTPSQTLLNFTTKHTMKNATTIHPNYSAKTHTEAHLLDNIAALYSCLLGEEITQCKLHHLIHVQISGLCLLPLAAWNAGALLLGVAWFASALYGAKTEWRNKE